MLERRRTVGRTALRSRSTLPPILEKLGLGVEGIGKCRSTSPEVQTLGMFELSSPAARPPLSLTPACTETKLHPQLHHRSAATAFVLWRLGYGLDVGMLLQGLPQRFAEDAHAAAVDYADAWQAG